MRQNELYSYVYDFVSQLMERLKANTIKQIILFGSVARGDFDKESDVDIFIDTNKEKDVEKIVKSMANEFYAHSKHTWTLRGIENQLNVIVGDLENDKWSSLRREIVSNGIAVYGQYKELPNGMKHYVLITYNVAGLKPKDKSKFIRELSGYRLLKGKKEYKIRGLLQKSDGSKISKSVLLVPKEQHKEIYDFIKKSRIKFEIREIWMKE